MKKPKFFCESCGTEVKEKTKVCPHCGKFFSSVRCPSCGTTGSPAEFRTGCQNCGYAFPPTSSQKKTQDSHIMLDSLPKWIYILSAVLLVFIIVLFVVHLQGA